MWLGELVAYRGKMAGGQGGGESSKAFETANVPLPGTLVNGSAELPARKRQNPCNKSADGGVYYR